MNKILLIYFQGDKDGKVRIILFVHTRSLASEQYLDAIPCGATDPKTLSPFFEAFNETGFWDFLLDYYCNLKAVLHNSASFRIEVASILSFVGITIMQAFFGLTIKNVRYYAISFMPAVRKVIEQMLLKKGIWQVHSAVMQHNYSISVQSKLYNCKIERAQGKLSHEKFIYSEKATDI